MSDSSQGDTAPLKDSLRLSQLLGCSVHDAGGRRTGVVTDVRLAQIGPPRDAAASTASFVVEALLVSPRTTGSLFGYERRRAHGPWLVRAVVLRLHRGAHLVAWQDVVRWDRDARRVELDHEPPERAPDRRFGHGARRQLGRVRPRVRCRLTSSVDPCALLRCLGRSRAFPGRSANSPNEPR
jgi:hypothetical protein